MAQPHQQPATSDHGGVLQVLRPPSDEARLGHLDSVEFVGDEAGGPTIFGAQLDVSIQK